MALCARLCGTRPLALNRFSHLSSTLCRRISIVPQPYTPPQSESHDERNMRLNRPQSPHITIYKFQLPANLSITHRFTGLALSAYVAAIGVTSLVAQKPMGELIQSLQTFSPTCLTLGKLLLVLPFTYHFCNGIRHLIWDTGLMLTMKGVYISGYIMLLLSALLCAGILYWKPNHSPPPPPPSTSKSSSPLPPPTPEKKKRSWGS